MANNTLVASDNFASGSLAAGWSAASGLSKCQVIVGSPNVTEPTALSTNCGQIWTGVSWPNDQTSEVIVKTLTSEAGTFISLYVRLQSNAMSGYRADFSNGILTILRFDSGVSTSLGSVSGLTFATGDRLTFQAAGASLAVYQNNKPILYEWDTTYPAGSPGYLQTSSVNITHTQVQSWSGYNGIQQDGIWKKQGILFPAKAAFAGNNSFANGTQNPYLIFEGNAQILSGNVYKMWYQAGLDLYYAESIDGITWTQYSGNPVITHNVSVPVLWDVCVFKVGATYHLYAGSPNVFHFTSTDGVTWSSGTQVFTKGTVGAWDDNDVFFFSPFWIDSNGTWWATYGGEHNNGTTFPSGLGLGTSPDGVTWTRHVGNPVTTLVYTMVKPLLIGGIWYGWGSAANLNQGTHAIDPGEGLLLQSSDLINWTNPINSVHHSQMFENVNGSNGGFFVTFPPINVNGIAHLYTTAIYNDLDATGMQQIELAIGPTTVEQIILNSQSSQVQVSNDSFQRANENPLSNGGKWSNMTGRSPVQLVSNQIQPSVTGAGNNSVFIGATFSNDQYSSVTLGTIVSTALVSPSVRAATNATTFYYVSGILATGTSHSIQIQRVVSGTQTAVGPTITITPEVGDIMTLSIVGSILSFYQNGFLVLQVEDSSPIVSGFPGVALFAPTTTNQSVATNWSGGNASVLPSYQSWSWMGAHRSFANRCEKG